MNQYFINILRKTRERIAAGWTQRSLARDAHGNGCYYDEPQAVSWCLVGALRVGGLRGSCRFESPFGGDMDMVHWNNAPGRTQADVLACIDNSIAALESEGNSGRHSDE